MNSLQLAWWSTVLLLLGGCVGTEGGNPPFDPNDSGPPTSDAAAPSDAGGEFDAGGGFDAGTGFDAGHRDSGIPGQDAGGDGGFMCGDAGAPPPSCTDTASPDCDCISGPPTVGLQELAGTGQAPRHLVPRADSDDGFVMVHRRACTEGCDGTGELALVEVDADLEVTGTTSISTSLLTHAAAVTVGDDIAVAWADDRDAATALYVVQHGRTDLSVSRAAESFVTPGGALSDLALASNGTTLAALYVEPTELARPDRQQAIRFVRLDGSEPVSVLEDTHVVDVDIAPFQEGWAVVFADEIQVRLQLLNADGSSVSTSDLGTPGFVREVHIAALGDGLVAGWGGQRVELRIIDNSATVTEEVALGPGTLEALASDGTNVIAAWRDQPFCVEGASARFSRLDDSGTRLARDVVFGPATFGMAMAVGEDGYIVASTQLDHAMGSVIRLNAACESM